MPVNLDHIELLTDEQIAYLRTKTPEEKVRMASEIHRRVRAEMFNVVRRELPFFNEEQVHAAVTGMLLTNAIPECINVKAIEHEVTYGSSR